MNNKNLTNDPERQNRPSVKAVGKSSGLGSVLTMSKNTNHRINSTTNILQELIDDQSYTLEPPFILATTFKSIIFCPFCNNHKATQRTCKKQAQISNKTLSHLYFKRRNNQVRTRLINLATIYKSERTKTNPKEQIANNQ